jgi:hypothetical protein
MELGWAAPTDPTDPTAQTDAARDATQSPFVAPYPHYPVVHNLTGRTPGGPPPPPASTPREPAPRIAKAAPASTRRVRFVKLTYLHLSPCSRRSRYFAAPRKPSIWRVNASGSSKNGRWPLFSNTTKRELRIALCILYATDGATLMS